MTKVSITPESADFDRGNRTYYVSDERLRAFAKLTVAERLAWVEQCAQFIRLARLNPPRLAQQSIAPKL